MLRQALPDELPVRRRLRRRTAIAAGQQRLFAHDGPRDDREARELDEMDASRPDAFDNRLISTAGRDDLAEGLGRYLEGRPEILEAYLFGSRARGVSAFCSALPAQVAGLVARHRQDVTAEIDGVRNGRHGR